MNWKGKILVLLLAGIIGGYFLFRDDPRFLQTYNVVSTHAQGLSQQIKHDFQGLQNTVGSLSKLSGK